MDGNLPELKDRLREEAYKRYGLPGLIVVMIFLFVIFLWWNWDHLRIVPGLSWFVHWAEQERIPQADPNRFAIAVAHLEGDDEHFSSERVIVESLKEVEGIQVIRIDRTISLKSGRSEEAEQKGHAAAQTYLSQSGADTLIWGTVLSLGNQLAFKLFWTTNSKRSLKWMRYQPTANLSLPQLFWNDLSTILLILVVGGDDDYLMGRFIADQLRPSIEKAKTLLSTRSQNWTPAFRLNLKLSLATTLSIVGEQTDNTAHTKEAVIMLQGLLTDISRSRSPLLWALVQSNLGASLRELGRFEEAIAAFHAALTERKRQWLPLEWARTQSNLGVALRMLGERETGLKRLYEAKEMLWGALEEQSQQRAPLDRAKTQNRLGSVLYQLALRENNASHLSEAEAAVRDALNQWNAEANPLFWAIAHMNLGNILQEAGGREKGTQKLELAITSYENAAKYLTRITSPRTWALIQNNLANSLGLLGKKDPSTTGTTRLKESVRRLYDALQIRTRISNPTDWAQTQRNLGIVLTYLGEREEGTKRFEEAIQAHRSALEIIFRQHMPLDWASIQLNLGATLRIIGQRKRDQALYCEALKCYQKAWYTFTELKANQLSIAAQRRVVATMEHLERDFSKQALRHCLSQAPQ